MQLTADSFLGLIKDQVPACVDHARNNQGHPYGSDFLCVDPAKQDKIKSLFATFLEKIPSLGKCEPTLYDNTFECPVNDRAYSLLSVNTGLVEFGMELHRKDRLGGYSIECGKLIIGNDLDENNLYGCQARNYWHHVVLGKYDSGVDGHHTSGVDRYALIETMNGIATELFDADAGKEDRNGLLLSEPSYLTSYDPLKSNCDDGLRLFDQFMSRPNFMSVAGVQVDEMPEKPAASSFTQPETEDSTAMLPQASNAWFYAGAAGTLYFGFKTAAELRKIWNASGHKSENKAESLQKGRIQQGSVFKAVVYAAATAASLVFTQTISRS